MKRLVIFDFDGVIADTMVGLEQLALDTLVSYYGCSRAEAQNKYEDTIGIPFAKQLEKLFPGNLINLHAAIEYNRKKHIIFWNSMPFRDAIWIIARLRNDERRCSVAVVSATESDIIKKFLAKHNIKVDWIGGIEMGHKEAQIVYCIDDGSFDRDEAIFFGDSVHDSDCAFRVGVTFCGVVRDGKQPFYKRYTSDLRDALWIISQLS